MGEADMFTEKDKLQAEYQKFLADLQQKGFCDKHDRAKLLEYFDRADRIKGCNI